jgi:peptidyl-prolyl cis-trans isomerase D
MKRLPLLVLGLSVSTLAACDSLGSAFSAHVDVVAKAGSQELTTARLADLLGKAKLQIPLNREVASLVARDLWVPYQLLGVAAARGDSLTDTKAIDASASAMLENARLGRFMESVAAKLPVDTAGGEAAYLAAKGDLYSARHILFLMPPNANPVIKDSVVKQAIAVYKQTTPANFAEMARKYSGDNTKEKGGDLGVFPRSVMVKPFGDALAKLKPGEISKLVETQYGFHIIQRNTWENAKATFSAQVAARGRAVAESTYIAGVQKASNIQLKPDAATSAKEMAKDPIAHRSDDRVLATFVGGTLTSGKLALSLMASPQSARLVQQIQGAPDSLVNMYVTNMAQREVLLQRADSAKIAVNPEELASLHRDFAQAVAASWAALGVDPKSLADSGKTAAEREKIAGARIEKFMDKIMAGTVQPVPVPTPLQIVLMNKFDARLNYGVVDRALEVAVRFRQEADSQRTAGQPKSAVPLPGALPPAAAPAPAAPAGKP